MADAKTTKLYHPTLADVTIEATSSDEVSQWVDSGWRKTQPKVASEK